MLRANLAKLGADLPTPLWDMIRWLETRGQVFHTTYGAIPFLAAMPVDGRDALWSEIYFESPPDLVRHWFGKSGLEQQVIPFIHCGGDGSYIALWRPAVGPAHFVFLGSEGEAFVVTDNVLALIAILTMGYTEIEGRFSLEATPAAGWAEVHDGTWPDPVEIKNWAERNLGVAYPDCGIDLLPFTKVPDPFQAFVQTQLA